MVNLSFSACLNELVLADGAILCWQVSNPNVWEVALMSGAILFDADSDLYVHPKAIKVCDGGYHLPD